MCTYIYINVQAFVWSFCRENEKQNKDRMDAYEFYITSSSESTNGWDFFQVSRWVWRYFVSRLVNDVYFEEKCRARFPLLYI